MLGAATSKLNRVVSRETSKQGTAEKVIKGKERESAVVEQDEGGAVDEKVRRAVGEAPKSPRVILGAVPDNWQMYRSAPLSSSAFPRSTELTSLIHCSCRPEDYEIGEPIGETDHFSARPQG